MKFKQALSTLRNQRGDGREKCEVAFENELTGPYRQAHFHCNLVFVGPFLCYFLWASKESKRQLPFLNQLCQPAAGELYKARQENQLKDKSHTARHKIQTKPKSSQLPKFFQSKKSKIYFLPICIFS